MKQYRSAEEYLKDWPLGVSGAKGDETAQAQLNTQNQLTQQQLDLENKTHSQISDAVSGDLSGTNGFSPQLLAMLQSQFQNQNTGAFQSAGENVRSALASKGAGLGDLPVGGDFTRGIAELEGAKASSQSQGLLGLGIQNLQQGLTNKYNAASVLSGNAAQLGSNVSSFNSGAQSALGSYVQAANAPGFLSSFATALGGGLGKLGATAAGIGLGGIPGLSGLKPPGGG